jgi:hypothetical protein
VFFYKTSMAHKNAPTKKLNSNTEITIPVINYLISNFANAKFKNSTLQVTAGEIISKLIETNDLNYLTNLATIRGLYEEGLFWEQMKFWKIRAFMGEKKAEGCLEAAMRGINKTWRLPGKPKGRPPKPAIPNVLMDYLNIQRKLTDSRLFDTHKKELDDLSRKVDKTWAKERIDKIIDDRRKKLKEFIEKNKIGNRIINLSDKELTSLARKTKSEMAKYLLAKSLNLGIEKIKQRIADEDPRFKEALRVKLLDGKVITIPRDKYNQAWIETLKELEACGEANNNDKFCESMSSKLEVPYEAIEKFQSEAELVDLPLRIPHKPKKRTRKEAEIPS